MAGATVLVNLSASNVAGRARAPTATSWSASSRRAAWPPTCTPRPGAANRPPTWPGTARRSSTKRASCWPSRRAFLDESHIIFADVDLERLSQERMRATTFAQSARRHAQEVAAFRIQRVKLALPLRERRCRWTREIERFPYVPADRALRDERCTEVYNIQVQALIQRLSSSGIQKVVIGVSGGLDSTHALLVCAAAMDRLNLPRTNILAYTMPGFATSERTLQQAHALMEVVGCRAQEIDIRPSCLQMLKDLGHPYAEGKRAVRRHLRERAGGRAHEPPVPAREPPGRDRDRHRRPVRAGAGLVHLRRGRPYVALQRERQRAQDPDHHLVRWVAETGAVVEGRRRGAAERPGHRDQPRAGARQARATTSPRKSRKA